MLTCWQGLLSGSGPVHMSPLRPPSPGMASAHLRCSGFTTSDITQGHLSMLTFVFPEAACALCLLSLCSWPRRGSDLSSVASHVLQLKPEAWRFCGFYLSRLESQFDTMRGGCCEHLLSHNAPGALGHSLWNDTGMLIDLEITRCFFFSAPETLSDIKTNDRKARRPHVWLLAAFISMNNVSFLP